MAGFEVTLHGRFWVTPEEKVKIIGKGDQYSEPEVIIV